MDSGATNHLTSQLKHMTSYSDYDGQDQLFIGDGSNLPISHTGSISLNLTSHSFDLNNVLCVPDAAKKLISVFQFCKTNYVSIEFFSHVFL